MYVQFWNCFSDHHIYWNGFLDNSAAYLLLTLDNWDVPHKCHDLHTAHSPYLLQNSPWVLTWILKFLLPTVTSCSTTCFHLSTLSRAHSGWCPLTTTTMELRSPMPLRMAVIILSSWLIIMGKQKCHLCFGPYVGTKLELTLGTGEWGHQMLQQDSRVTIIK